jgi:hypothetical protein
VPSRPPTGLVTVRAADLAENDPLLNADVVVIGSGAGGAIAADELVRNGAKTC